MTFFRAEIEQAAKRHGLDADLLEALVLTESSGRADAFRFEPDFYRRYLQGKPEWAGKIPRRVSSSYGLCQVMYSTALEHGFNPTYEPEMLFLPATNLDLGAKILASLLAWAGGVPRKALAAYNGGKGNWKAQQPQDYAAMVLATREAVRKAQA
jgi:soluble lytic murein transglycosylase-like protein